MNVDLKIHMVTGHTVAFSIGDDVYFLCFQPVPRLYDADLVPQTVNNFDNWFLANTSHRHSYRNFCDMVDAFAAGLSHGFTAHDLRLSCEAAIKATRDSLLIDHLRDYILHFQIEALDPVKLETTYLRRLIDNFDQLRRSLGDERFYNDLCRLWRHALRHRPGLATVFEKLIQRLDRTPGEPVYPETCELDARLRQVVLQRVLGRHPGDYKGVSEDILHKLRALERHGDTK